MRSGQTLLNTTSIQVSPWGFQVLTCTLVHSFSWHLNECFLLSNKGGEPHSKTSEIDSSGADIQHAHIVWAVSHVTCSLILRVSGITVTIPNRGTLYNQTRRTSRQRSNYERGEKENERVSVPASVAGFMAAINRKSGCLVIGLKSPLSASKMLPCDPSSNPLILSSACQSIFTYLYINRYFLVSKILEVAKIGSCLCYLCLSLR